MFTPLNQKRQKPVALVSTDPPPIRDSTIVRVRPTAPELRTFLKKLFGTDELLSARPPINQRLASDTRELGALAEMMAQEIALARSSGSVFVSYAHLDMEAENWLDQRRPPSRGPTTEDPWAVFPEGLFIPASQPVIKR